MVWPEVGSVDQYIEGFATWGRDFRFRDSRSADIGGGVGCWFSAAVNRLKLFVRIGRKNKIVVDELLVPLVEAEVENNA